MWIKALLICGVAQAIWAHPAPDTRDEVVKSDVTFQLFSRSNPDTFTPLVTGELAGVTIDTSKPFKFIIHGYSSSADSEWVQEMKNSFLLDSDCNVIAVDWAGPALSIYSNAALYTREVAVFVGQLIIELCKDFGASYEKMHMIGHSLGAHTSGFTGKYVTKTESAKLGRITGMDPAGPKFDDRDPTQRLSDEDAIFVDIIHTDMHKYGYENAIGHVDFFPNGGNAWQPGCLTRDTRDLGDILACGHGRSHVYFNESINSVGFVAKQCGSYDDFEDEKCDSNPTAVMGQHVDQTTRGIYYLKTNDEFPYAKN